MDSSSMTGADRNGVVARTPWWLRVSDCRGSYTIPYIQSGRDIRIAVSFRTLPGTAVRADLVLRCESPSCRRECTVTTEAPTAHFAALQPGEYELDVRALDSSGAEVWARVYESVGVGTVVAALGDSLTEGYHGHGFKREDLDVTADSFPPSAVSRDGRNFPQFAPTAARHKPSVNAFQSWMTRLNDRLSRAWRQPVFIANEGWGGMTSGDYLRMIRENRGGWGDRIRRLCPTVWLIHLGVNDERQGIDAATFASNMRRIIDRLCCEYGADAGSIYIARPSYDYAPGAAEVLRRYITELDAMVSDLGVRRGPDFFAAFAADRARWYGDDPVHPGPTGFDLMADLWLDVLVGRPSTRSCGMSAVPLVIPGPGRGGDLSIGLAAETQAVEGTLNGGQYDRS